MSLQGLKKFNEGFGYRLVKGPDFRSDSRSTEVIAKILCAIPFFGIIVSKGDLECKKHPAFAARCILCSTIILALFIVFLDLIATAITIPLYNCLENRRIKKLANQRNGHL